jgi:hypothetical protein
MPRSRNAMPSTSSARFSFLARAEELRELAAAAENAGMSSAAYIRARMDDIFDPVKAGRRWPTDPAQRRRSNAT